MSRTFAKFLLLCVVITYTFGNLAYVTTGTPIVKSQTNPSAPKPDLNYDRTSSSNWTGRIAVVKPIFTDTAYANAFYVFYQRYASSTDPYITKDLNLFNVTVKYNWGWSGGLATFLGGYKAAEQNLTLGKQVTLIDEINVTLGGLFHNGNRVYDVLVLGFTEYVTIEEYYAYKEFVASGGTLIIMDACNFLAQVKYYPPASPGEPGYLSLVKGHGWEFNGTHAWKSVYARWSDENENWVGSNYWHWWAGPHYDVLIANTSHPVSVYLRNRYGERIGSYYGAHEENTLQNLTNTKIIGYWNLVKPSEYPGQPIAAYQHMYVNGSVFHAGIMASDRISSEEPLQAFLVSAVRMALLGEVGEWEWKKPPPPPPDANFYPTVALYTAGGEEIAENEMLFGIVRCHVYVNDTSIIRGGQSYTLISVRLLFYPETSDPRNPYSTDPTANIEGRKTDDIGLEWDIVTNTTAIPDGEYKLTVYACCGLTTGTGISLWTPLAVLYHTIDNNFVSLRIGVVVVLASFASLMALTYSIFVWDRKHRRH